MRIAVIGLYHDSNLGDRIICDCVYGWLKEKYPQAVIDIVDITGQLHPECGNTDMKSLWFEQYKRYWRSLRARLRKQDELYEWCNSLVKQKQNFFDETASKGYDMAVFAGGQLFMDTLVLYVCAFIESFQKAGTLVFCNACGMGSMRSKRIQSLLSEHLAYENVKFITSRDNVEDLNEYYLKDDKKASLTYDPALWTRETYLSEKSSASQEKSFVGLGVMYMQKYPLRIQIKFWRLVIRELNRREIEWKFFCNGNREDYNLASYILKKEGYDPFSYMYECASTPKELVEQISSFSGMITCRLHSHIIGASLGCPAIAVVWDDKVNFFYEHLGQQERCLSIYDDAKLFVDRLSDAIEKGTAEERIQKQKEYAKTLLLEVIEKEWTNE